MITLNGVIKGTGDANLIFSNGLSGGQGKIIIANNATYSGTTVMTLASSATTTGIVALGVNDALPIGTRLTLGNVSGATPSGTFDLAGFNQTVAGLESLGTGYLGGITNTSTSITSTLTIKGNLTTSFGQTTGANTISSNIGQTTISGKPELANSNNNIALVLDAANTGTLTLARPTGNTYSGGTTINGGKLVVTNTSGSATGAGAVTVNSGGTLAGTGAVSGAVTVNSGGFLAPGTSVESLAVGALTFSATSTLLYEIDSSAALAVGADLVNVALGVLINPATILNATDIASTPVVLPIGTKFTLLSYDTTAGLSGAFAGQAQGSTITIGLTDFMIDYADISPGNNFDAPAGGGSFSYVTLTAVPEATSVLFGSLVCIVLGVAAVGRKLLRRSVATC